MATGLGTLDWVEKTGGKLAWYDKLNMIFQGVKARAASNKRLREGKKIRYMELDDIIPPDSPIATEALNFCAEVSPRFLVNHSMRAWFWARLLDDQTTPVDHEVTYVALMLHDIGLTDTYKHDTDCFTLAGARKAQELALKHNWDERRTDLVANAITLHVNILVNDRHGKEAQLVEQGTGADVVGLKLELFPQDQINDVLTRYPRLNQNRDILDLIKKDNKTRPCCRMAQLYKMGMGKMIKNAPFPE